MQLKMLLFSGVLRTVPLGHFQPKFAKLSQNSAKFSQNSAKFIQPNSAKIQPTLGRFQPLSAKIQLIPGMQC